LEVKDAKDLLLKKYNEYSPGAIISLEGLVFMMRGLWPRLNQDHIVQAVKELEQEKKLEKKDGYGYQLVIND